MLKSGYKIKQCICKIAITAVKRLCALEEEELAW